MIEIKNLTHIYGKNGPYEKTALNNVNHTFEDGSKESKMTAMEYVEDLTVDFDGSVKISEHNGVPFVEYIYQGENDEIVKNYKVFCYKGEDGFWMVHFITEIDYSLVYKPYIFEWLETIEAK